MDMMQVIITQLRQWVERLRKVIDYIRVSFLPSEETKEESDSLIWWF